MHFYLIANAIGFCPLWFIIRGIRYGGDLVSFKKQRTVIFGGKASSVYPAGLVNLEERRAILVRTRMRMDSKMRGLAEAVLLDKTNSNAVLSSARFWVAPEHPNRGEAVLPRGSIPNGPYAIGIRYLVDSDEDLRVTSQSTIALARVSNDFV